MYKITLKDGTILNNLTLSGNNFTSQEIISNSTFENNLDTVIVEDEERSETHTNMFLVTNRTIDNKSCFILAEKTPQQIQSESLDSNITDIQMALVDLYESILGGN